MEKKVAVSFYDLPIVKCITIQLIPSTVELDLDFLDEIRCLY